MVLFKTDYEIVFFFSLKQTFDKVYNSLMQLLDEIHIFYFEAN